MKQTTKMSRAVSQLEHIYNALNTDFYGGELPVPVITVQSKPGTMGHCSTSKVWRRKEDGAFELNIAAEALNAPIEETIDTMLHEMVHLYCREKGIKETSRGGTYHNGRFKKVAEAHGLTCIQTGKSGWNTTPGDNLVEYAMEKGWSEIQMGRGSFQFTGQGMSGTAQPEPTDGGKRPSSTRKLICPSCGQTVRATKKGHNVVCGFCMVRMEEAG